MRRKEIGLAQPGVTIELRTMFHGNSGSSVKARFISFAALIFSFSTFALAQGRIPRTPDGKPDFSGVWDHPPIVNMSKDGKNQKGAGDLPYTEWSKAHLVEESDNAAHCLPLGHVRNMGTPFLMEIFQRPSRIVLLHEFNNEFHVVFMDGRSHPKDLDATWAGHSTGKMDGDTLVIDTIGFNERTRLDVVGHPHTDALHVIERYALTDADHIAYEITIDDPKAYTRPWKNTRTFARHSDWEVSEYNCNENNKDVREGHVK